MATIGADERAARAAAIEARRDLVVAEYQARGQTEQAIADALGVSRTTVHDDLCAREIPRRPRGPLPGTVSEEARRRMSDASNSFWRAVEQGRTQAPARYRRDPVVYVCEYCGERFTLTARQLCGQRGRFCKPEHFYEWLRTNPAAASSRDRVATAHEEWLKRVNASVAEFASENGLMDLPKLVASLPTECARSLAAVRLHLHAGFIESTPNEFGALLFSDAQQAEYVERLRNHQDGRLRRFADLRFRARWLLKRHNKTNAFGALGGRPSRSKLDDEPMILQDIRSLRAQNRSEQNIAEIVSTRYDMRITRKMVRYQLARQQPSGS